MGAITGQKHRKSAVGKGRSLSEQDWVFINAYLECGSASKAYHIAGRNGTSVSTNAMRWLMRPQVQKAINDARNKAVGKVAKKLEITVDKVLEDLEDARTIALMAKPAPQCAAAIKASELQGRHIGMFRDDYDDREKAPIIRMSFDGGAQIAIIGKRDAAMLPPPLPINVIEEITDDDLL